MRPARRSHAWLAFLGFVTALVVFIQQQRGEPMAEDFVTGTSRPADGVAAALQSESTMLPAADRASTSHIASDDEDDGVCTQVLGELTEFAEAEKDASEPLQAVGLALGLSEDQVLAEWDNLIRRLTASPDPELFLSGVLLNPPEFRVSEDSSASATLLELGVRAVESGSPLHAWHALRACVFAKEYCPYAHLEQDLLEADRENAETWALAATLRYRRGDVAGALAAMQDAANASTSTWYWTETAVMAERAVAEQWAAAYPGLVGSGLIASSSLPKASSYQMCRDESPTSRAWAEACLAFGTLRGEFNGTEMARGLAFGMREQALRVLGDEAGADEVAREYALFGLDRNYGALGVWQALLTSTTERFHAYLSAAQEHGEVEGRRVFLRQELPPLMQRAGLLEREGAIDCAARLFEIRSAVGPRAATYRDYPVEDYPIQVGDQLHISIDRSSYLAGLHRVGPDGMIAIRRIPDIAVMGKTTGLIEQEIRAEFVELGRPIRDVYVILMTSPSPEELRLEFDNALQEAAARREEIR